MANNISTRDVSFDAFRGICIIAVIAIHAATSAWGWYGKPSGSWNYYTVVLLKQLYVFAVPAFFFMAGYFSVSKTALGIRQSVHKTVTKLKRILLPYVIWSLFSALVISKNYNVIDFGKNLLMGKAQGPYYFLIVLTIFILLTPLFQKLTQTKNGLSLILAVNTVTLVLVYYFRFTLTKDFSWYHAAIPFTTWILFYYLGMTTRQKKRDSKNSYVLPFINTERKALFFVLISLALCLLETILIVLFYGRHGGADSEIKLSTFLYSISIISYFFFLKQKIKKWPQILIYIGECSFGIYLIHEFFRVKLSSFWGGLPILPSVQPLLQMFVIGSTLLVCLGTIYATRKILGKRIAATYLGF
ncbi:MAG: acyltransferase [Symploca sp. SIO2B6]|nr:acyltransferase [Symploca sp. SIO2B6]